MTCTRRIWTLPALAITLVLAACSTPEDLTSPQLEPQFGSANDDIGVDVALASTGHIFALVEESVPGYDSGLELYDRETLHLQRYDKSGNFIWSSYVESRHCVDAPCAYNKVVPKGLYTDAQGYVYVLFLSKYEGCRTLGFRVGVVTLVFSHTSQPHHSQGVFHVYCSI